MGILSQFSIRRLPWYTPIIAMSIVFAAILTFLLWRLPARSRRSEWVEVSRGEWLRAVRHTPTGRCFVRYSEGGIVETAAEVCASSR